MKNAVILPTYNERENVGHIYRYFDAVKLNTMGYSYSGSG